MKSIYSITRGQLITLWVFGTPIWLFAAFLSIFINATTWAILSFVFIPPVLIFYTLGWRNARKAKGN